MQHTDITPEQYASYVQSANYADGCDVEEYTRYTMLCEAFENDFPRAVAEAAFQGWLADIA